MNLTDYVKYSISLHPFQTENRSRMCHRNLMFRYVIRLSSTVSNMIPVIVMARIESGDALAFHLLELYFPHTWFKSVEQKYNDNISLNSHTHKQTHLHI